MTRTESHTLAFAKVVVIVLLFVSSAAFFLQVPVNAQLSANIVAADFKGSMHISKPGGETFWPQITGAEMPLTATNITTSGYFSLTLIEIMDSEWNSTLAQPMFYVQGDHGLESSANISLPARTLIRVTIVSHDTPTPGNLPEYGKVSGTVGGTVYLINGTIASGTNVTQAWGQNVTSVPADSLAHTFTIQQLGINIPVIGGSTVIAYLYFDQPGTFTWICLTPCGFGPNGAQGAMSTPGWMTGSVTITPPKLGETPAPSSAPVSGGINFETAAMVSFGMLVVGFVAGLIVISRFALPKKPESSTR